MPCERRARRWIHQSANRVLGGVALSERDAEQFAGATRSRCRRLLSLALGPCDGKADGDVVLDGIPWLPREYRCNHGQAH